jgi:hypothetical protein
LPPVARAFLEALHAEYFPPRADGRMVYRLEDLVCNHGTRSVMGGASGSIPIQPALSCRAGAAATRSQVTSGPNTRTVQCELSQTPYRPSTGSHGSRPSGS